MPEPLAAPARRAAGVGGREHNTRQEDDPGKPHRVRAPARWAAYGRSASALYCRQYSSKGASRHSCREQQLQQAVTYSGFAQCLHVFVPVLDVDLFAIDLIGLNS